MMKNAFCSSLCAASGPLRCGISNGGCWKEKRHGRTYTACTVSSMADFDDFELLKYC